MYNYLNIIYKFTFKLFYLMIFFEIICFKFPCVAGAQNDRPQTPHPIWKDICPCKSSIWRLTLSNSSVVDFYPLTRDFNWNTELLLWRAGFVFSTIDFCRYLFAKFGFDIRASVDFIVHFFLWLSFQYLRVRFPNSEFVSNSNFAISFQDWRFFFQ